MGRNQPRADDHHAATRVALLYGVYFVAMGVYLPFFPIWLEARGLNAGEIALVLAAPYALRLVAVPALAFLADRMGDQRAGLVVYGSLAALFYAALLVLPGFVAILLVAAVATAFSHVLMPLAEAVAMAVVHAGRGSYGRMRLWGSVTFILASLMTGYAIDAIGADSVVWLLAAALIGTALVALGLPRRPAPGGDVAPALLSAAARLFAAPAFFALILGAGLVHASHAVYYVFGSLHWQQQGLSGPVIGALWSLGVVAEIVLFWFAGRGNARRAAILFLLAGGAGAALRWWGMGFDPPFALVVLLQLLHALSFGAAHLGMVAAVASLAPRELIATAQGLAVAIAGLATALTTAAAGPLYAAFSGGAYWVMGLVALAGTAAVALSAALQPQRAGSGG